MSAFEVAVQHILAGAEIDLLASTVWRIIVQLLLAERSLAYFFVHACNDGRGEGEGGWERGRDGDSGRPSLCKCYLACHASKISVAGWS